MIMKTIIILQLITALSFPLLATADDLDNLLKKVKEKEVIEAAKQQAQKEREAELKKLQDQERDNLKQDGEKRARAFKEFHTKYRLIAGSSTASNVDKKLAWAFLCKEWLPGFEECAPVNLIWNTAHNGPYPERFSDVIRLLASVSSDQLREPYIKDQISKLLAKEIAYLPHNAGRVPDDVLFANAQPVLLVRPEIKGNSIQFVCSVSDYETAKLVYATLTRYNSLSGGRVTRQGDRNNLAVLEEQCEFRFNGLGDAFKADKMEVEWWRGSRQMFFIKLIWP